MSSKPVYVYYGMGTAKPQIRRYDSHESLKGVFVYPQFIQENVCITTGISCRDMVSQYSGIIITEEQLSLIILTNGEYKPK